MSICPVHDKKKKKKKKRRRRRRSPSKKIKKESKLSSKKIQKLSERVNSGGKIKVVPLRGQIYKPTKVVLLRD